MTPTSWRFETGVTLLGAGPVAPDDLNLALGHAPDLLAADGGADTARKFNKMVTGVIGDLDSLSSREFWQSLGTPVLHLAEQDTTDFEKCLYSSSAPLTLAVGFLGGRVDHELAVLSVMARYAHRAIVALGAEDVVFHCPKRLALTLSPGTRFSIFPLERVRSTHCRGLRWCVEGLTLCPTGQIGTSNETSGPVELAFDAPGALIILPRTALSEVLDALTAHRAANWSREDAAGR